MTPLSLRLFPDPVLRKKAEFVRKFDPALAQFVQNLDKLMRSQRSGIGIAAPQVGISKRIALVDVSSRVPGAHKLVLVNPELVRGWGEKLSREGCMSLPDYTGQLKRFDKIQLRWQDEKGIHYEREFEGIEAVCIQHELDHLEGLIFMDRVSSLKRDMIPRAKGFGPK